MDVDAQNNKTTTNKTDNLFYKFQIQYLMYTAKHKLTFNGVFLMESFD